MRVFVSIYIAAIFFEAIGCTLTPYRPLGVHGGYTDVELDPGTFRIFVKGQFASSYSNIKEYFDRRAKEVCQRYGNKGYKVVSIDEKPCTLCLMVKPEVLGTVQCLDDKIIKTQQLTANNLKEQEADSRLDVAVGQLVQQMFVKQSSQATSVIAVLPMADITRVSNKPLGLFLADKITSKIYLNGHARVIERSQLGRVIEELALTRTGTFDEASAKKIGSLLGVNSIVIGSYAEVGDKTIEINSRLVTVETGEVLGVGSVQFTKAAVLQMLPQ